jgi:hypothetical protein
MPFFMHFPTTCDRLRVFAWGAFALMATSLAGAQGVDFGTPGSPPPANLGETAQMLRKDAHDLELLISFGTSKGGSAGHLALSIREPGVTDDMVYSANFYADRTPEHAKDFLTADLMLRIPKMEYLYGTRSSLGDKASFGLDFGEVYKRSVVGVRVYGVPAEQKAALAGFYGRLNRDYTARADRVDYHYGEVKYGYLDLNCAKTIGLGFKVGAGYADLDVKQVNLLFGLRAVAAATANIPMDMAVKLIESWHARGYGMDVVLYKKAPGSLWIDPHDSEKVAFKDLPNRFPSVLSRDFLREQGQYKDYDNLYAGYLLYNLAGLSLVVEPTTGLIEIDRRKSPMSYPRAAELAERSARADTAGFFGGKPFRPEGTSVAEAANSPGAPAASASAAR